MIHEYQQMKMRREIRHVECDILAILLSIVLPYIAGWLTVRTYPVWAG